jgi:hypothetical protein
MNAPAMSAAILAVFLGLGHSYLGERYILIRLLGRTDLPRLFGGEEFTRHTLRFAWHLTTVAWFGLAAILVVLAGAPARAQSLSRVVSLTFAVSGVVSVVGSRGRHLSWVVFFLMAGLAWIAFA